MLSYIEENYHQDISLESAATEVFMNKNYLSSLFCSEMGVGFTKYINDFRLKKAKILLRETELNINEIANMTGFATANYFVRVFKKQGRDTGQDATGEKLDTGQLHSICFWGKMINHQYM